MSTPLRYDPQPDDETLGIDGASHYFQRGSEVWRAEGDYAYHVRCASCWPQSSVAKRIAGREAERALEAAKSRRAVDAERARKRR